jgi:hypothetical protein
MPHWVCPVGQLPAQVPAAHTWPPGQAMPHPPQLLASLSVFVQTPEHSTNPGWHTHAPLWHS